jgi:hypothetical protein
MRHLFHLSSYVAWAPYTRGGSGVCTGTRRNQSRSMPTDQSRRAMVVLSKGPTVANRGDLDGLTRQPSCTAAPCQHAAAPVSPPHCVPAGWQGVGQGLKLETRQAPRTRRSGPEAVRPGLRTSQLPKAVDRPCDGVNAPTTGRPPTNPCLLAAVVGDRPALTAGAWRCGVAERIRRTAATWRSQQVTRQCGRPTNCE